jgi:hypothetical protein
MYRFMTILMISLATSAYAGEVHIVETESGVVAEYTGSPSSVGSDAETPATAGNHVHATRVNHLNSQIEQLQKEKDEILTLSGNETEEEVALVHALADEKNKLIEDYDNEIRQLTGNTQKNEADMGHPREEQPLRQKNYRQEKKRQIKELKKLPATSPPSANQ